MSCQSGGRVNEALFRTLKVENSPGDLVVITLSGGQTGMKIVCSKYGMFGNARPDVVPVDLLEEVQFFQDPGTPLNGFNLMEQSPKGVLLYGLRLPSLTWTRGYLSTRVPRPALVKILWSIGRSFE